MATITHELTEWPIGRLIEKLLDLNKPLYLQRKWEDKFWIHGTKQKYVLEQVLTTFSETYDRSDTKFNGAPSQRRRQGVV